MYQKYTTEGFLVGERQSGEADKLYLFYTAEFGMILASARSVRSLHSKLRPHVKTGARLSLTLLKSKNRWKLLEASVAGEPLVQKDKYKTFFKLLSALKQLAFGEERNESLFESIREAFIYLSLSPDIDELPSIECLAMIKILHSLGYGEPKSKNDYQNAAFSKDIIAKVSIERPKLIKSINTALNATGL